MVATTRGETAMPSRKSVVVKLTLFVAALLVVTTSLAGLVAYGVARSLIREQIHERLRIAATDRHAMVLAYVAQQHERAGLVASRTKLRQLVHQYVEGTIDAETMRRDTQPILRDALASTQGFVSIAIADPQGEVLTATHDQLIGQNLAQDAAFQPGLSRRHLSAPRTVHGEHRATLVAPAYGPDDSTLGVVMVELDVQQLYDILNNTSGLGSSGEVLVGMRDRETVRYLFPTRRHGTREVGAERVPTMAAAIAGNIGSDVTLYDEVDVLTWYQPIAYQATDYQRWGLVAKLNAADAWAPLATLRRLFLMTEFGLR